MRVRLRTRPVALFGGFLLIAAIVFLPMRLALGAFGLGDEGLTARRVTGTVWGGRLIDARFGDVALGDLDARLSPFALLIGQARVALSSDGGLIGPPVSGSISVSRHGFGLDDATARVRTGRVFAPLPVSALDLDRVTAHFRDGQCETAEGRVRASLSGDLGGVALPPTISGAVKCDGGALLLTLASQAGAEEATLRVEGDGRYRAGFAVTPTDPAMGTRLEAAGFLADGGRYRLSVEGRF